jgi:hypothetical protein
LEKTQRQASKGTKAG